MSSYVSTNRLRTHVAGGLCGRAGTACDASGLYAVAHGLGTPTIFGACMESSAATTTAQYTRRCRARLSGAAIVVRILTGVAGTVAVSTTAPFRWFATE